MFGNVLKSRKKDVVEDMNPIPMRIEVAGKVIDLDLIKSGPLRKTIKKHTQKQRNRLAPYKDLVDSKGQRIAIVFKSPQILSLDWNVTIEIPEELQPLVKGAESAERIA